MTRRLECNCICCNNGKRATKILGRLVVGCQRCFCCCDEEPFSAPDNHFAISVRGLVIYIGENGKLPENGECY